MANLTETFTNIANAIRSKRGTTATITPSNMASNINNITINTTYNYKYILTINTDASATISATKSGSTSKSATANTSGVATLTFTNSTDAGTWTVTCTKNGFTKSTTKAISFS